MRSPSRRVDGALAALLLLLYLQPPAVRASEFADPRDGSSYPTVRIGDRVWLARNLGFETEAGSRCQSDAPEPCPPHDRLYQWTAAMEACPPGWRLPSEADWQELEHFLGVPEEELEAERYRGTDEGQRLRTGGGTGFDVELAGYMRADGTMRRIGERAAFWSSTLEEGRNDVAWHRDVSLDPRIYRSAVDTDYFLSVRCLLTSEGR